jgi:glucosamine-6-phosphate deaminase
VHLDSVTRLDAAADFFGEENVPREAVTMAWRRSSPRARS